MNLWLSIGIVLMMAVAWAAGKPFREKKAPPSYMPRGAWRLLLRLSQILCALVVTDILIRINEKGLASLPWVGTVESIVDVLALICACAMLLIGAWFRLKRRGGNDRGTPNQ